jgi:hypothetical protein
MVPQRDHIKEQVATTIANLEVGLNGLPAEPVYMIRPNQCAVPREGDAIDLGLVQIAEAHALAAIVHARLEGWQEAEAHIRYGYAANYRSQLLLHALHVCRGLGGDGEAFFNRLWAEVGCAITRDIADEEDDCFFIGPVDGNSDPFLGSASIFDGDGDLDLVPLTLTGSDIKPALVDESAGPMVLPFATPTASAVGNAM